MALPDADLHPVATGNHGQLADVAWQGLVPTLEFEGKPLYESTVICEFLEEQYANHGTPLLPPDAFERAQMRLSIEYVTTRIVRNFHQFLQFQPSETAPSIEGSKQTYLDSLKELTRRMDERGPFFTGKQLQLIDIIAAPWALRNWIFDHFKGGLGIPPEGEDGQDEEVWQRYRMWEGAVSQRRSLQETTSEREYYLPIYQR
ncbi:uncharacterized protein KY384_000255 [Bacidia gigantensis]|uniref:uncharacterized protein n=1 Tax=Bacidia gigantensis TaxID=2732470 RepID=UPI001D03D506|nr:uncharacterized protein KY384_000255 [Bacidia gigantensis]KAG8526262.1 hypothetical protein KY384_000255 [Bacidia gigantensis]